MERPRLSEPGDLVKSNEAALLDRLRGRIARTWGDSRTPTTGYAKSLDVCKLASVGSCFFQLFDLTL
jgi:hypothetical protein